MNKVLTTKVIFVLGALFNCYPIETCFLKLPSVLSDVLQITDYSGYSQHDANARSQMRFKRTLASRYQN